ncbi:hypothetical protein HDU93_004405, partial [Gonapodya sp. JEL0774]
MKYKPRGLVLSPGRRLAAVLETAHYNSTPFTDPVPQIIKAGEQGSPSIAVRAIRNPLDSTAIFEDCFVPPCRVSEMCESEEIVELQIIPEHEMGEQLRKWRKKVEMMVRVFQGTSVTDFDDVLVDVMGSDPKERQKKVRYDSGETKYVFSLDSSDNNCIQLTNLG